MIPNEAHGAMDETVPPGDAHSSYCYCDAREGDGHPCRFPRPSAGVELEDRRGPGWEAVLRFDLDQPEGRRALRLALDGESWLLLFGELDEALRETVKYDAGILGAAVSREAAEAVRSYLRTLMESRGLDPDRDGGY